MSDCFEYLGNRVGLQKDGSVRIRPAKKRFDRFRERLREKLRSSTAFTKIELLQIALEYAEHWFRSQGSWTKQGIGAGSSKCEGASWNLVLAEVELCVNLFMFDELQKHHGKGPWHEDDINFALLELAGVDHEVP